MRKTKIFKAFVLSLILFVAVSLVSYKTIAATLTGEAIKADSKGTITVRGVEKGLKVSVYQLTEVNFDDSTHQPTYPPYSWNDNVKTWLLGEDNYKKYADNLEALEKGLTSDEAKANFYDDIAAAIKGGSITLSPANTVEVGDTGTATTNPLAMGTYLVIIENGFKVYKPSVVNLTPVNVEVDGNTVWQLNTEQDVTIKSSDVGIKIGDALKTQTSSTTDVKEFELTADVPQYPTTRVATKYYISGVLENGLTLKADSIEVYGVNGDVEENLSNVEGAYKLENARPGNKGTTDFTLNFDYSKISTYESIRVRYQAELNQGDTTIVANNKFDTDGTTILTSNGNKTTTYLDYSNNPYDVSKLNSQEDSAYIFTYGITVNKVDANKVALAGAEFELIDGEGNAIKFLSSGEGSGIYYKSEDANATTTLVVGNEDSGSNKGILQLRGLDNGTYTLKETKAPDGYNKLLSTEEIEVNNASQSKEIVNSKGFQLPLTGGMGTVVFTAAGVILIGLGIVLLVATKRKNKSSN